MGNICCGHDHDSFEPVLSIPDDLDDDLLEEIKNGAKKEPVMKMKLRFSCEGIKLPKGKDFDPCIAIFKCDDAKFSKPVWTQFKTESIPDISNPEFVKQYTFDFKFEEMGFYQVRVYNIPMNE